jgi:hypothetical protein
MPLAGCTPVRPPLHRGERIHGFMFNLVQQERRLQGDGRVDGVPRNVIIPLYSTPGEFEATPSFEFSQATLFGIDSYRVPISHRLLIHSISAMAALDQWDQGAQSFSHTNSSKQTNNVVGMSMAQAMIAMLALKNVDRGSSVGTKLFEDTRREPAGNLTFSGICRLNAVAIAAAQGACLIDYGARPYIALPGEELRLEIRGPGASGTVQLGIVLDGTLVPEDEEP